MKHQPPTATTERLVIFKLLPEGRFFQIMEDFHRLVARRAYELFSASGFTHGHDVADRLQAESEILKPVHFEISETDDVITAKAALPGYDAKDIEIHVEPQGLFVSGKLPNMAYKIHSRPGNEFLLPSNASALHATNNSDLDTSAK